ncbi:MAG: sugar phosphate isomerase/epimerase, partial [Mycobacterium sp.]|nr:sugar phosphate isomerase/epimerase [Mycobacterium sp.]
MELRVFQSLWAMGELPYGGSEWSTAEKVDKVVEGGFDGIEIAWIPDAPAAEAVELAQSAGMRFGVVCIPASVPEFRASIEEIRRLDPRPDNIDNHPAMKEFSDSDGAAILRECVQIT